MTEIPRQDEEAMRVVFVSGPSGAGRSTAIRALEDLGFEAIDNLPDDVSVECVEMSS